MSKRQLLVEPRVFDGVDDYSPSVKFLDKVRDFISSKEMDLLTLIYYKSKWFENLRSDYKDLKRVIELHNDNIDFDNFFGVYSRKRNKYVSEAIRYINHYITSALSIVELSRKEHKKFLDLDSSELKERRISFMAASKHETIKQLRNTVNHVQYLPLQSSLTIRRDDDGIKTRSWLVLDKNRLYEKDKSFYKDLPDRIDVSVLMRNHFNEFCSYNEWLTLHLMQCNNALVSSLIVKMDALQTEFNELSKLNGNMDGIGVPFRESTIRFIKYLHNKSHSTKKETKTNQSPCNG